MCGPALHGLAARGWRRSVRLDNAVEQPNNVTQKGRHPKGDLPMKSKKALYLRLLYALLALASLIAAGASSVNWG